MLGRTLPGLGGKSLLIFDESLMSKSDHWFEYDLAIARMHAASGAEVEIVSHRTFAFEADLEAVGATVLPLAEQNFQTVSGRGGAIGEWAVGVRLAWHFSRLLSRLLAARTYDCVFYHTAQPMHLLSWKFLSRRLRKRAGRVVFATWLNPAVYDTEGNPVFPRRRKLWRLAAQLLRAEFASDHFVFLTDSARVAEEYRLLAGLEAGHICSPRTMFASSGPPRSSSQKRFVLPGAARVEKGIDVFQEAIAGADDLADPTRFQFIVQWNKPVYDASDNPYPRDVRLGQRENFTFLDDELSSAQYQELLHSADCVVLPYRLSGYRSRTSAVAIEAACAGVPMIYTDGGWLGDFVREFGAGIAVADGDERALAGAVRRMREELSVFKAQAAECSESARQANSPEAFLTALWGRRHD